MNAAAVTGPTDPVAHLRVQARITHQVVRLQFDGITHVESLLRPASGGNSLNWVIGHLLTVEGIMLSVLGQQAVMPPGALARYERGAPPLTDGADALELARLLVAWDEAAPRIDAGFAAITAERLAAPAGSSPTGNPNETVGSLLATLGWHQAYHAGQAAILRRFVGKPGAIP